MKRLIAAFFAAALSLALAGHANAQGVTRVCVQSIGANGSNNCQDVASTFPFPVAVNPYPAGATPIMGNATGTTGAVVGTLAGASGKTTYICGFSVSAIGGTAAVGPITVANTITANAIWHLAATASGNSLTVPFSPCIPATGTNTAITITTTADGTASAVDVNSWGFQF